jgi:hypothetical protein
MQYKIKLINKLVKFFSWFDFSSQILIIYLLVLPPILSVFYNNDNHPMVQQSIDAQSLMSTFPQTELKYHPASVGMMCDQHFKVLQPLLTFLTRITVQISNYPNSSQCWVDADPVYWSNISPQCGLNQYSIP